MALRDDFKSYFDGNGLLSSSPVTLGTISASDNGPMFLAEYEVMLQKSGLLTDQDRAYFTDRVSACLNQGLLCRRPVNQNQRQEGPDDYVAVLNACKQLEITSIPRQFLWSVFKYKGALNNVSPGTWSWSSFLIRQPQLLAAMIAASFPSYSNPLHFFSRFIAAPLFLIAAVSLAISCIGEDTGSTDPRRLSWHLWQSTKGVSLMCWFAGLIWLRRLKKDYPGTEMNGVAAIYYYPQGNNPYQKYWITD